MGRHLRSASVFMLGIMDIPPRGQNFLDIYNNESDNFNLRKIIPSSSFGSKQPIKVAILPKNQKIPIPKIQTYQTKTTSEQVKFVKILPKKSNASDNINGNLDFLKHIGHVQEKIVDSNCTFCKPTTNQNNSSKEVVKIYPNNKNHSPQALQILHESIQKSSKTSTETRQIHKKSASDEIQIVENVKTYQKKNTSEEKIQKFRERRAVSEKFIMEPFCKQYKPCTTTEFINRQTTCAHCNKQFTNQNYLKIHLEKVHKETEPEEIVEIVDLDDDSPPKKKLKTSNVAVKEKFEYVHKGEKCNKCGKKLTTYYLSKDSKDSGNKTCSKCLENNRNIDIDNDQNSEIVDDPEIVEENEKNHRCNHCGKSFNSKKDLQKHISIQECINYPKSANNLHEVELDFKCEECGKFFSDAWILEKHVDYAHKLNI